MEFETTPLPLDLSTNEKKQATILTEESFSDLNFLRLGTGAKSIILDIQTGMYVGAEAFTSAPFSVDFDGKVIASNITITGGSISGITLSGLSAGSDINIQGWTSTMTFSATDYRTITWTSGVITLANGTTFSIGTGNTGNMAAVTYIYFDKGVSTTALQVTTTAATAVGANKILIAVAQNNTDILSKATLQVFGGKGGQLITVDQIAANSASVNEFISNTAQIKDAVITSAKIASLNANVINAGTITGRTLRTVAPAAGTGSSVVIEGGNDKIIQFYYNATLRGSIKGYTTEGSEVTYIEILAASGRSIKLKNSRTEIDGAVQVKGKLYPSSDNSYELGDSSNRWSKGHFEDIDVDDIYVRKSFDGCGSISGCAYIEVNLLDEQDIEQRRVDLKNDKAVNYTGFEIGDVLCWSSNGLKKSEHDLSMCVTAISDKNGMPIVLGAEYIKVVGKVAVNQFLVTSSVEGVARGWENKFGNPPAGTVIAQSMEYKNTNEVGLIKAMIRKF